MRRTSVWAAVLAAMVLGGCSHVADDVDPGTGDVIGDLPGEATLDLAVADEAGATDVSAEAETQVPEPGPEAVEVDETLDGIGDGDGSPEVPPCECLKDEDCAAKGRGLGSCQAMWCDTAACECKQKSLPDQTGCDDGNPCTTPDTCQAGACVGGANTCQCQADADCKAFDDDNLCNGVLKCDTTTAPYACKVDPATVVKCEDDLKLPCRTKKCETATGKCLVLDINEGQPCDDKSLCTVDAKCAAGDCVGASQVTCTTANLCANAVCVFGKGCTDIPNNLPCDDGEICTVGDQCGGGACVPGAWDPCDDQKDCTQDSCEKGVGCHHVDLTGTACEDGDACTAGDLCDAGACVPGAAPDCDDQDPCTDDSCDHQLGCVHSNNTLPCDDGDLCTLGDACAKGKCVGGAKKDCNDGNACTKDGCVPATGECTVEPVSCDDKNACTIDTCDSLTGCAHTAVDCDDGNACTTDSCTGNTDGTFTCNHKALSCDDKIAATVDTCDPATGCVHVCDDKNPCTVDLMDAVKGCLFTPVNCDDGDACTTDACDKTTGQCTHVAKTCAAPTDKCQVATCDKATGTCGAAAKDCTDADTCTVDSCDAATGACVHTSKTSNSCGPCQVETCDLRAGTSQCVDRVCDDKNPCTDDACDPTSGACMFVAKNVDDGNPCTADACDPATGAVTHLPIDVADGNPCTVDHCDPATGAVTHVAKDCKDLGVAMACKDCACNPYTGVETLVPRSCADADNCTLDYCDDAADACVNVPIACSDSNPCTNDACDPATGGCTHVANTAACATASCQGLLHFGGSTCAAGACPAQAVEDCDDYNPCTDDNCDAAAGCGHAFNAAPCATARCDGLKHYSATACSLGACGVQVMEDCDDGNVCTTDGCDVALGCTHTPVAGQCAAAACVDATTFRAARQCDAAGGCIAATTADCTPYLCGATGCPTGCASDGDCVSTHFCNALTGTCVKRLAQGAACNRAGQCDGNHCVDGVCCDGACGGTCQTCAMPGFVGQCKPADAGTDPRGNCNDQGAFTCGLDGQCDGNGACRYYKVGTECAPFQCNGNVLTPARKCLAPLTCGTVTTADCAPYQCAGGVCTTACAVDGDCDGNSFCDAGLHVCLPKRDLGGTCDRVRQCAGAQCVDGVCCDGACVGTCLTCARTGFAGNCKPASAGTDPRDQCAAAADPTTCGLDGACNGAGACEFLGASTMCHAATCKDTLTAVAERDCTGTGACAAVVEKNCSPYLCAGGVCPTSCASNAGCASTHFCDATNKCVPRLPQGSSCTLSAQCAVGPCVDGFCCDGACTGTCMTCKRPDQPGTCLPATANTDPRSECTAGDPLACGLDGQCNGAGACRFFGVSTQCEAAKCLTGTLLQPQRTCTGAGACETATSVDCSPYPCSGGACQVTCSLDTDCVATSYCDATSHCAPRLVQGSVCGRDSQCAAGPCVQGFCCESACTGTCMTCARVDSPGRCLPVPNGTDPRDQCADLGAANCTFDGMCDGAGACRKYPNGTGCGVATCDGLLHYAARTCSSGACLQAVQDDNCDDGNPCTADSCTASGCHHGEVVGPCGAASCVGSMHFFAPQCGSGLCQPALQDQLCVDSNLCTDDACTVAGCTFAYNTFHQSCYDGPGGTAGVGLCTAGTQTCASGAFGPCVGQVIPTAESCNGKDDDCNGVVDNGSLCAARQACSGGACNDCPTHCSTCTGPAACTACDAGWAGATCGTNVCTGQSLGAQPAGCAGIHACDGNGSCLAANGQGCTGAGTCASGICFDGGTGGLCCNQACDDGNACTTDSCGGGTCTHTLSAACPDTVGWCQVFAPKAIDPAFVTDRPTVVGQVYIAGITDQTDCTNDLRPEVVAQLGIAPHGKDPTVAGDAASWTWASASAVPLWNACDAGFHNNDGYQATLVPPGAGSWDYAFRFSANGGFTWTYCDATGTPYATANAATLGVKGTGDVWCRLQWPATASATAGSSLSVFGRVYAPGATTVVKFANDPVNAALKAQFGYGPRGTVDPSTFTWAAAAQSVEYATAPDPEENNDEYKATVVTPAPGDYDYAFRFSLDAGATWVSCDRTVGASNGSADGYQPDNAGKLTSTCGSAQYFLGGACLDCDASCATCSGPGPGACQSCGGGKFLKNNACVASCGDGWFGSAGVCTACLAACTTCTGAAACTACDATHFGATCASTVTCDTTHGTCAAGTCSGPAGTGHCDGCTGTWTGSDCTVAGTPTFWVVRVGDGSAALTGASTAVFIDRVRADGTTTGLTSIALPTAVSGANQPFTISGTSTSEGGITRVTNGGAVVLAGYAAAPGVATIATSSTTAVKRAVAKILASGTDIDTTTMIDAFSGGSARGAASVDGTAFWASGSGSSSTQGVYSGTVGSATVTRVLTNNARWVGIFGGQLYGSASTSIYKTAAALPTTADTLTALTGVTESSAYGFAILTGTGGTTLYVADDSATAGNKGVKKYALDLATGAATYSSVELLCGTVGCRGLAATEVGGHVYVVATSNESAANSLYLFKDDAAGVLLLTAPALTAFRGVSLAP